MAKFPIPVHLAKTESGADKIITSKKKVEELGANAFIVSKAALKKLDAGAPEIDYEGFADAVAQALGKMPATILPAGVKGSILRAMKAAND